MHYDINTKRNKSEKKKLQLAAYEKTDVRKFYVDQRNKSRYAKKLIENFTTDTGFDVICCSCLQYKSYQYCTPLSKLSPSETEQYLVTKCPLLKNRRNECFVCNLCYKDIKKGRMPKRSQKNKIKYASFPDELLQKIKRHCHESNTQNKDLDSSMLNRLESYLLKLVIPFIRVANCPRGKYLRVKGDLILISSNVESSLSKILPRQQNLIPVSFKRKLSYSGAFMEEFVEKRKLQIFFSWFKKNNHLYKDIDLDEDLLEAFLLNDSVDEEEQKDTEEVIVLDECQVPSQNDEDDAMSDFMNENPFDSYHGEDDYQKNRYQKSATMFMNKYCEDPDLPSIANKLAEMIVNYETTKKITIEDTSDFEVDDDILNEEEYLKYLNEVNELKTNDIKTKNSEVLLEQNRKGEYEIEEDSNGVSTHASKIIRNVMRKIETNAVAPAEYGSFQNWGKDVFLEEKAFPEKFPLGCGGYLSSCIDDEDMDIGFSNYCINQLMSCDPKFRNDYS